MTEQNLSVPLSDLFGALSQPARIDILLAIGNGEACVCHLEASLKMRQAYISQHLMALREMGILTSRRDGRFIFYRIRSELLKELIKTAAELAGLPREVIVFASHNRPHDGCCCPHCAPVSVDGLVISEPSETSG